MSQFTEYMSIRPIPKRNLRETTEELRWEVGKKGSNIFIIVPKGFVFDGATIPKFLGGIAQKVEPKSIAGACLHDYGYMNKTVELYNKLGAEYVSIGKKSFSRHERDCMYRDGLVACGTNTVLANIELAILTLLGYPIRAGWIKTT